MKSVLNLCVLYCGKPFQHIIENNELDLGSVVELSQNVATVTIGDKVKMEHSYDIPQSENNPYNQIKDLQRENRVLRSLYDSAQLEIKVLTRKLQFQR